MKIMLIMGFLVVMLMGCHHYGPPNSAGNNQAGGVAATTPLFLAFYEAFETAPYWNLRLTNGTIIEFEYPGPISQLNETLTVDSQTSTSSGTGWVLEASNSNGNITVFIVRGDCTDAHVGGPFRDEVMVAANLPQINYIFTNGCGGGEL